jgi:hypothetical protein
MVGFLPRVVIDWWWQAALKKKKEEEEEEEEEEEGPTQAVFDDHSHHHCHPLLLLLLNRRCHPAPTDKVPNPHPAWMHCKEWQVRMPTSASGGSSWRGGHTQRGGKR